MTINTKFPQVAVGAVLFYKNQILLVKRGKAPAKNMWALPGGKVLPGERLQQALIREIKEETNLDISVGELVYTFDVIEKDKNDNIVFHYVILDFECSYIAGKLNALDDAVDAVWASEKKLRKLNVNERTATLLRDKYNFY